MNVQSTEILAFHDKAIDDVLGEPRVGVPITGFGVTEDVAIVLLGADIGLLPAGSVHNACTVNE
jgi:hypothetical protein